MKTANDLKIDLGDIPLMVKVLSYILQPSLIMTYDEWYPCILEVFAANNEQ